MKTTAAAQLHGPSAAVSLIGVIFGGCAAWLLIPEDFASPGQLAPAGAALSLGLLFGPGVAALRDPMLALRAECILSFGLVYWLLLDAMLGNYGMWGLTRSAVELEFMLIAAFAAMMWLGYGITGRFQKFRPRHDAPHSDLTVNFLFAAAVISGALGFSRYFFACKMSPDCLLHSFEQPRFSVPWLYPNAFGSFDTLFYELQYIAYLTLPLSVALLRVEGRMSWRSFIGFALAAVCLLFVARDGGRRIAGMIVGAGMLVWILLRQRLTVREVFLLLLMSVGLLTLLQFMLEWRTNAGQPLLEGMNNSASSSVPLRIDTNLRFFANVIYLVPDVSPHTGWDGVRFQTLLWANVFLQLPDLKVGLDMPGLMRFWAPPNYSWTCSAACDFYLIAGVPCVLFGGTLYGIAANFCSRLLSGPATARRCLYYALAAMTLFLGLRSIHEIFIQATSIAALWGFILIGRRLRIPRPVN